MAKTKHELLRSWTTENPSWREENRMVSEMKKEISTARGLIADAAARYRKSKLKARSKAAAETEDPWADLADYTSERDILDAYGFDCISGSEYDRLMDLWHLREDAARKEGRYEDRVTLLLEHAMWSVGEKYAEQIEDFDNRQRDMEREAERISHDNADREYERKYGKGM